MKRSPRLVGETVRRSRPIYTVDQLLRATLGAAVMWPGRTTRMERDSLSDYTSRSTSGAVSIAELYHENSKLTAENLAELASTSVDVTALRQEFLRRRTIWATNALDIDKESSWASLASEVFRVVPDLFYAVDVRIVIDKAVAEYEPGAGLRMIRNLVPGQHRDLLAAVRLLDPVGDGPDPRAIVMLMGCFPRNDILFGARGYRRTLIEAGQLTQEVARKAAEFGHVATVRCELADRKLDSMMEADGVEYSVVVAIELG